MRRSQLINVDKTEIRVDNQISDSHSLQMHPRPALHIYDQDAGLSIDYPQLHAQLIGGAQFETHRAETETCPIPSCIHRCEQRYVKVHIDFVIAEGVVIEAECTFISGKIPACTKAG